MHRESAFATAERPKDRDTRDTFARTISRLLAEKDIGQKELAALMGITGSAVNQWTSGISHPNHKRLAELATHLDVPIDVLYNPAGMGSRRAASAPAAKAREAILADVPIYRIDRRPADQFAIAMNEKPIGMARRWAGIELADMFAIHMLDETMAPWRERGDLVYARRGCAAAEAGNHVLVEFKHRGAQAKPRASVVRKLIYTNARSTELYQYNPAQKMIVPTEKIESICRILEWSEIMGV